MHIRRYSLRFIVLFLFLLGFLILFTARLVLIQIFNSSYLADLAEKQQSHVLRLEPKRGTIYDRNLRPLAFNNAAYSLFATPRTMTSAEKQKVIERLPHVAPVDRAFVKERLGRDKNFIWLLRKIDPDAAQKIRDLKLSGLNFVKESRRYYPSQTLAAHVIGFANMDNEGLEGLELQFNHVLKGEFGLAQILRDARQKELLIEREFQPPKDGFDLVLTIDQTIQYIAEQAVQKAFEKHHAQGASLILMDPKTGEILAMVNRPTYNLDRFASSPPDLRRNRAISDMLEPGSVFKIVTASAALEEKKVSEEDKFFCENGAYRVANHVLHDHRPHGTLTFRGVIEQSSNIGVVKVAQALGPETVNKYAKMFRFGIKTGIELPGELNGFLKPTRDWSKTSIGAVPIGQEVGVTALQLVCAMSVIANDGVYMKPFVVKAVQDQKGEEIERFSPQEIGRVISAETARRMKSLLTGVVDNGTAKLAQIKGVKVAGKTGTAQKVVNGTYSHEKFYATFIGFAPSDDPRIVMAVVFDEPHPSYFGGTVSAPVFKEVTENVLKYLQSGVASRAGNHKP